MTGNSGHDAYGHEIFPPNMRRVRLENRNSVGLLYIRTDLREGWRNQPVEYARLSSVAWMLLRFRALPVECWPNPIPGNA